MPDFSFFGLKLGATAKGGTEKAIVGRTRISGRTLGFNDASALTPSVIWKGMAPVSEGDDQWKLVEVVETANTRVAHLPQHEQLVEIRAVSERSYDFKDAVSNLGIWELTQMRNKLALAEGHDAKTLDRRYFKYLAARRNLAIDAYGKVANVSDGTPLLAGKFLKSDMEMFEQLGRAARTGTVLDELVSNADTTDLFDDDFGLNEQIEGFGHINTLEMMYFFSTILVNYARVKLDYANALIERPQKTSLSGLFDGHSGAGTVGTEKSVFDFMNADAFFSNDMASQFNILRKKLAEGIFKMFHIEREDWDKTVDLENRSYLRSLEAYPEVYRTASQLTRPFRLPFNRDSEEVILYFSARALVYLRNMFEDTASERYLTRKGTYKRGDVEDLLSFLDLVEAKVLMTETSALSFTLPMTASARDLQEKQKVLQQRLDIVAENYENLGGYGPAEQKTVQTFISTATRGALPVRIAGISERIAQSRALIMQKTLPSFKPA